MSENEKIASLNRILAIIDEKAAKFQDERFGMHPARKGPEKKLILDLISDALSLARSMSPQPFSAIDDLRKLEQKLTDLA